jgi:hypothetical protein
VRLVVNAHNGQVMARNRAGRDGSEEGVEFELVLPLRLTGR